MKYIVIGGVAAGMSAASKIKKMDKKADVKVFEKSHYVSYGSCGLPYYIEDKIKESKNLIVYTPQYFKEARGIDVFVRHEVINIDIDKKEVEVLDIENNDIRKYNYDKLIITTGASAIKPPIKGINLKNIFTLRQVEDGEKIKKFIKENNVKKVAIIGAGYIGLEMVEAFSEYNIEVHLIEKLPQILPNMDKEIADIVQKYLIDKGIKLYLNSEVIAFEGNQKVEKVVMKDKFIDIDFVLLSIGVKPNSELAKKAGIKTGVKGAITVDEFMKTNIYNIYSAGDCAEVYHRVLKRNTYIPLGTTANKQGKTAGINAAGGNYRFKGVVGTGVTKVFDMEIARTGLSEREVINEKIPYHTVMVRQKSKAHYFPGADIIHIKIIFDKYGKLLGAQMVGKDGVSKRIDIFATALFNEMNIKDIEQLDLSYAPPFAPVYDPVIIAASLGLKKLKD